MKLKRILPIIVAVSVLLCAFVPFAVSADASNDVTGNMSDPISLHVKRYEDEYTSRYGGFIRIVGKVNKTGFPMIFYAPPIGANIVVDNENFTVTNIVLVKDISGGSFDVVLSNGIDGKSLLSGANWNGSAWEYHDFNHSGYFPVFNYTVLYSDTTILFDDGSIYFSPPVPSPLDSVKNVDMSPALVEVLGVLPACLACLVAYASIRKGIGYVHSIISNA